MHTSSSTTPVHCKRSVRSDGWRLLLCLLMVLTTLVQGFSTAPTRGQQADEGSISSTFQSTGFTPGVVLVGLQPGVNIQNLVDGHTKGNLPDRLTEPGARYQAVEPVFGAQAASRLQAPSLAVSKLDRIYRLRLAPGTDVLTTVEELRAHPGVEFAEPDYVAMAGRVPDDPQYGSQWALAKVNAPAAWDVNTGSGTPSPVIAIVDSGLDIQHADLKDRIWTNTDEKAGNGLDDDGNGKIDDVHGWNFLEQSNDVMDENGHGTQVAGVAAATTNNGVGISGMCWSCLLMPVKVMQSSGSVNYSDIASAVAYAAAEEADVINLSLGGYADSQTLRTAIESAAATAVIVAGAGNDGKTAPFYPAAYPEVIAVAASNDTDVKSSFSNYGSWVDASSPGENILTTLSGGNAYGAESGTSLSAPLVAGLAGLLKSQHPDWSPALIRQQIIKTGASIDAQNPNYKGLLGRRVDAGAALGGDPQPEMAITRWTVDGSANAQPAPGQTFELRLSIQNTWLPARSVSSTLSENDAYATVKQAAGSFGDLNTGKSATNTDTPFVISLAANTPYSHTIPFTLKLTGQDGYTYTLTFSLSVRSGIEQVPGGTTYIEDTIWTSDKTYFLKGNVVVDPGVTLTIQPGTHISVNAGSWLRVDGTLIAAGTAQNPITITTSDANGARWSGLRFTDTSGSAVFDANEQYLSGSILRYVNISGAETAVSALSRAPYIVDSIFEECGTAVSSRLLESGGLIQIERSSFRGNDIAISIDSGQARIYGNIIKENKTGITGSGSPTIVGNSFTDNTGSAIRLLLGLEYLPIVVRDNRLIGNGDGMYIDRTGQVEIEHNLIALSNNSTHCQPSPCPIDGGAAIHINAVPGEPTEVRYNTVIHNNGYALMIGGSGADQVTVSNNNWLDNGTYDVYSYTTKELNLTNNFWGDIPSSQLAVRIYDCNDTEFGCGNSQTTVGRVLYNPPLSAPAQEAPAFVRSTDVTPDPLGLEQGTFDVTFSRPMTTTLPTLSFHDSRRDKLEPVRNLNCAFNTFAKDLSGRIWIAAEVPSLLNGCFQVYAFDGSGWKSYSPVSDLSPDDLGVTAILGASDSSVWFGYFNGTVARLKGNTWLTYTPESTTLTNSALWSIAEDDFGNIWFADSEGTVRFNGSSWKRYSMQDGLAENYVRQIVRDADGKVWFRFNQALTVFDGKNWTTHNQSTGLLFETLSTEFADSKGRIWVGGSNSTMPGQYIGMFDGKGWTFYKSDMLKDLPISFAEAPDGKIWVSGWTDVAVFDGSDWQPYPGLGSSINNLLFDANGNLWILQGFNDPLLQILWGGLDYPILDNGRWLSDTQYQATYTVTPIVPKGSYTVEVTGAAGLDGMEIPPDTSKTFLVDYAGYVSDATPPSRPTVTIQNSGSLTSLTLSWWSTDPEGISQYRYALGTKPGGQDVVSWKYVPATMTSVTLNGLMLAEGQTYYATVAAQNASGLWSENGISAPLIGGLGAMQQNFLPMVHK